MHLIANRWYAVLSSRELGQRPVARRRFGLDLVFWRHGEGGVAAAVDRCPHRRAKLSGGSVKSGQIQCPFHGFTFDGDGECTSIPAHPGRKIPRAMSLDAIPATEAHGFVWLFTGPDSPRREPPPFFDFDGYVYDGSEFTEEVAVHYTVAIENQLDFAHLPFVHRRTIGRFVEKSEVDVSVTMQGDHLRATASGYDTSLELLGPNLWRLDLGRQWQMAAFVPIDEDRMLYYIRNYQRIVTIPGVAWLFGFLQRGSSRYILREDSRVVETLDIGETRLSGKGEVLVPSDAAIIAYRRWREAHRAPFEPFASTERELRTGPSLRVAR